MGWKGERGFTLRIKFLRSRPMEAPGRDKEQRLGTTQSWKGFGELSDPITPKPGWTGSCFAVGFLEVDVSEEVC